MAIRAEVATTVTDREALEAVQMGLDEGSNLKEKAKLVRAAINSLANALQIDLRLRK